MVSIFKMPSPSNEEKSDYYREYASSINYKGPDPAPHQQAALTEMVEWYKQGKSLGGILVLPTGGGSHLWQLVFCATIRYLTVIAYSGWPTPSTCWNKH